jgi:hypothetical protein
MLRHIMPDFSCNFRKETILRREEELGVGTDLYSISGSITSSLASHELETVAKATNQACKNCRVTTFPVPQISMQRGLRESHKWVVEK